jgi:hypothetical protein
MSVLIGALGSVIGYLGGDAAEASVFERLLWPRRFYHQLNFSSFAKQSIFMTMGGPLHAAALQVLDVFRDNGLYLGRRRGNMLGTAFYTDIHTENFVRTSDELKDTPKESRNGFWVQVLRNITKCPGNTRLPKIDSESNAAPPPFRAMQLIHHLTLELVAEGPRQDASDTVHVREDVLTMQVALGIVCSELSAVAVAAVAGARFHCWWLIAYMCIPLVLKLLALCLGVRRHGLQLKKLLEEEEGSMADVQIFEVKDPNHGFVIIEGLQPVVHQFFGHYGHPKRDRRSTLLPDRLREVCCIALVYMFVLYFPVGLFVMLWAREEIQILWLAYQLYAVVVMHLVRILGWAGCGRTEERVAKLLSEGKRVVLESAEGCPVAATLKTSTISNMKEGKKEVEAIIRQRRVSLAIAGAHGGARWERTHSNPAALRSAPSSAS